MDTVRPEEQEMQEAYAALIEDTCRQMGVEDAAAVAASGLMVVDGIDVCLEYRESAFDRTVVVYADLGTVPDGAPPGMLRNLLEANLLWAGTGGATIGLHPDTAAAILAYSAPLDGLTGEGLAAALAQFAHIAGFWRTAIAAGLEAAPAPAPAPAAEAFLKV